MFNRSFQGKTTGTVTPEDYHNFILEVLQVTLESKGDKQAVYQLLEANLDKLDDSFTHSLQHWATNTLSHAEADKAQTSALSILIFSNLIQEYPLGNKAVNQDIAIAGYLTALSVYTRDAFPVDWAMTQNNLGNAYSDRIKGDRRDYLELAINAYTDALQVRTRDAFPVNWAMTQNNLGNAYSDRIKGDRRDYLELAINAYTDALQVRTRDAFPVDWAMTQNNLGIAYRDLKQFDEAIECFKLALEIRTPTTFPIDCLQSGRNLGETASLVEKWLEAIFGYDAAIQAVEQSREWASSLKTRRSLLENAIDVYNQIVQGCINTNQIEKAIEYVERSKARTLVELLANRDLYPKGDIPQELLEQLKRLKREIPPKQQLLEVLNNRDNDTQIDTKTQSTENILSLSSNDVKRLQQELNEWQSELEKVLEQIKPFDPSYQLTQKVEPISFREIRDTIENHTPIIAWYISSDRFFTFIITREDEPLCKQSDSNDLKAL
ncbi:MAG: tetratricopeptide repeat protein [Rhizonema sp. PD38]|nr:tetratricopeptide repeat protein [Rhizonema sp. PD38]